ncbi:MAG: wax ester/triacylglycerol synthase family O-acyltransferase [Actinomycetia bacterium]|nr:wax ester/triacylglycerol synthase family O-acyltransferase [Actinomycetes bacterium]
MPLDRLSAQDVTFLHLERPHQPMHAGSLLVFDEEPFFAEGRFRLDEVRATIANRLHLAPRLRRRLLTVPLRQGRPIWVDDEHFDIAYHVRLTALPRPGSHDQLCALMGRLQMQPLNRDRPLWELWFVEGVAHGRIAVIQKTHQALVDDGTPMDVVNLLLDLDREPDDVGAPFWDPEPAPTGAELLGRSLVERVTVPAELASGIRTALQTPRHLAEQSVSAARSFVDFGRKAPGLPWNQPMSNRRRYDLVKVDLDRVRRITDRTGTTVNDVVLAAVTGAMRDLLMAREQPVDGLTLRALVPLSVDHPRTGMALGSDIVIEIAELPVGESDPTERLRLVSADLARRTGEKQADGAETLLGLSRYAPPTLLAMAARLISHQRPANVTVVNVPGPAEARYCMGARLLETWPWIGTTDTTGPVVAVVTYDDALWFGLTADRDLVPDLAYLAERITAAIDDLSGSDPYSGIGV